MQLLWIKFKEFMGSKNYEWKRYNLPLVMVVLLLCIISIFTLWVIGSGMNKTADYRKQIIGTGVGLVMMLTISLIDYHFLCRFVIVYYVIITGLVAATRFSPIGTDLDTQAFRWISLPGFNLQPSELCKVMVILVLAVLLTKFNNKMDSVIPLIAAVIVTVIPVSFIMMQPDLSSSLVVIFVMAMMVFAAGLAYKIIVPVVIVMIPTVIGLFWYVLHQPEEGGLLKPYQVGRIAGFLDPDKYPNAMFQQNNSIDAISSGKLYGKFILGGVSDVRNYNKVDVTESDFIWSAIGEEFGFIGSVAIVAVLFVFIILCLLVVKNAIDNLGRLIAIGIASMFMFQVFANIGVATRMLPNTGLPLPFISSGLSSHITYMLAVGILLNIGIQPASKALGKGFLIRNNTHQLSDLKYDPDITE